MLEIVTSENFYEVIKSGPVLVDFYADWCGPCKMIAPVLEELSQVYSGVVRIVKVNVNNDKDLAIKYQIYSIPNLLAFKNGELVKQVVGFQTKTNLIKILEEIK
ncbi:MAG TPA: thioredoxin [Erysipelotrichaceae bacterium]|jgi:thioredoxin 1|nr:thioredoxin [Erysipelotrichaceae bacterium]HQB32746.1 thioredoxin [Erysipelotrichaceae bacterium]